MGKHVSNLFNTYSIVAFEKETGQLGVAVQTHQMSVGSIVPWLIQGVGALATQSLTNVRYGPMGLALLQEGVSAPKVVESLITSDEKAEVRQLGVVDAEGRVGAWTGEGCIPEAGHHIGDGYCVQANMMYEATVVESMSQAYEGAKGSLAERMMVAMKAAQSEGGDIRGMQSASLKIMRGNEDLFDERPDWLPLYDLRVDEHEDPITELDRLVRLRGAQVLDHKGYKALEAKDRERALEIWEAARTAAPELEETGFWQAVTLADKHSEIAGAVEILAPILAKDDRKKHWIELIRRIQECGIIERKGAGDELVNALNEKLG